MFKKLSIWAASATSLVIGMQKVGAGILTREEFSEFRGNIDNLNTSNTASNLIYVQIGIVINYVLGILGLITFILLLYGGFTILTAQGSEDKVAEGRKIIMYTILGTIIIAISYAINSWIFGLSIFTGVA